MVTVPAPAAETRTVTVIVPDSAKLVCDADIKVTVGGAVDTVTNWVTPPVVLVHPVFPTLLTQYVVLTVNAGVV